MTNFYPTLINSFKLTGIVQSTIKIAQASSLTGAIFDQTLALATPRLNLAPQPTTDPGAVNSNNDVPSPSTAAATTTEGAPSDATAASSTAAPATEPATEPASSTAAPEEASSTETPAAAPASSTQASTTSSTEGGFITYTIEYRNIDKSAIGENNTIMLAADTDEADLNTEAARKVDYKESGGTLYKGKTTKVTLEGGKIKATLGPEPYKGILEFDQINRVTTGELENNFTNRLNRVKDRDAYEAATKNLEIKNIKALSDGEIYALCAMYGNVCFGSNGRIYAQPTAEKSGPAIKWEEIKADSFEYALMQEALTRMGGTPTAAPAVEAAAPAENAEAATPAEDATAPAVEETETPAPGAEAPATEENPAAETAPGTAPAEEGTEVAAEEETTTEAVPEVEEAVPAAEEAAPAAEEAAPAAEEAAPEAEEEMPTDVDPQTAAELFVDNTFECSLEELNKKIDTAIKEENYQLMWALFTPFDNADLKNAVIVASYNKLAKALKQPEVVNQ